MRIRAIKLWQLGHLDGNLSNAGAALAKKAVRSKPGSSAALLSILPEAHVDCAVVFRSRPGDVVQAAVANLEQVNRRLQKKVAPKGLQR